MNVRLGSSEKSTYVDHLSLKLTWKVLLAPVYVALIHLHEAKEIYLKTKTNSKMYSRPLVCIFKYLEIYLSSSVHTLCSRTCYTCDSTDAVAPVDP